MNRIITGVAVVLLLALLPAFLNAQSVKIQHIEVNGMTFNCRVAGNPSDEPVILLHGWPETSHMWIPVMKALASEGYYCVAPDQRGFSPQARPKKVKPYHIDSLIEDVSGLANAINAEKFHLIGHDWGSAIGWAFINKHPERIQSWSALSVPHVKAFSDAIRFNEEQKKKSKYMKQLQLKGIAEWFLLRKDRKALREAWSECPDEQLTEYLAVIGNKPALKSTLAYYRANYKTLKKGKGIDVYGDTKVPSIFIWGNDDIAVTRAAAEGTNAYMKGEHQFIEVDAGHWLIQEAFDKCYAPILKHLRHNE